jgi:hypothetical protein
VVVIQIEMMTTGQTITITKTARRSRTNLETKRQQVIALCDRLLP